MKTDLSIAESARLALLICRLKATWKLRLLSEQCLGRSLAQRALKYIYKTSSVEGKLRPSGLLLNFQVFVFGAQVSIVG